MLSASAWTLGLGGVIANVNKAALICVLVPLITSGLAAVPLPETVAPPALLALSVPMSVLFGEAERVSVVDRPLDVSGSSMLNVLPRLANTVAPCPVFGRATTWVPLAASGVPLSRFTGASF